MGICLGAPSKPNAQEGVKKKVVKQESGKGSTHAPEIPDFGFGDKFTVKRHLGSGGSGAAYLCIDNETKEEVAIKFLPRKIPESMVDMISHEVQIQAHFGAHHVNVIGAKELILTPSHLALVMELAGGGTLTSRVQDRWDTAHLRNGLFLSEDEARYYFKQCIRTIEYFHTMGVVHRDIKLDNTLLDRSRPPRIKICDFGFARTLEDNTANVHTRIGTPVYMSPELISSKRTKNGYNGMSADVWACGVLLYVMLLGTFPFDNKDHSDDNSSAAHYEIWMQQIQSSWKEGGSTAKTAQKLSPHCQDLFDKIFVADEVKRISMEGIKTHPWYLEMMPVELEDALKEMAAEQERRLRDMPERGIECGMAIATMVQLAARDCVPTPGGPSIYRIKLQRPKDWTEDMVLQELHGVVARMNTEMEAAGVKDVKPQSLMMKSRSMAIRKAQSEHGGRAGYGSSRFVDSKSMKDVVSLADLVASIEEFGGNAPK